MSDSNRPRIQSLQAVYGFLLVLCVVGLAAGAVRGMTAERAVQDAEFHTRLTVFAWLLTAFAFAVPFAISTMTPANLSRLASGPEAARDLAEQQFIDHSLLGALPTALAVLFAALLVWHSATVPNVLAGVFAFVLLAGRFPYGGQFHAWCRRCGIEMGMAGVGATRSAT